MAGEPGNGLLVHRRLPQEHGEVVRARHQSLWLVAFHSLIFLQGDFLGYSGRRKENKAQLEGGKKQSRKKKRGQTFVKVGTHFSLLIIRTHSKGVICVQGHGVDPVAVTLKSPTELSLKEKRGKGGIRKRKKKLEREDETLHPWHPRL